MIFTDFKGYVEGRDITKIPMDNLAYPSKNVIVTKGKVVTRGGIVNDGTAAEGSDPTHSEFVWKDAAGGIRPLRCTGTKIQLKWNDHWYTIFESLDADVTRVIFATWVDGTAAFIKKRLFMVDGSTDMYQWTGAIAVVASYDGVGHVITLDVADSARSQGFDDASGTNQNIRIIHLDVDGNETTHEDAVYSNDPSSTTISLTGALSGAVPAAGDLVIALPVVWADQVNSTFALDAVYSYKNHVIVANYDSVNVYWSNIETYALATGLDFTQPSAGSRTAITAIYLRLDGNFKAMIARQDVLWVSDTDDWYKVTKSVEQNAYDLWVDVEKFETGERKGALPMAVAKYKGDIIYMAQDNTLQRVTTVAILGTDEIQQLSDVVEALLQRLNTEDVRLYYIERAIYIICPQESTMIILDMIEGYYQPPQILPINCMSIIEGVKYGHSNVQAETFTLFSGRNDLGTPIESVIAFGYYSGIVRQHSHVFSNDFQYKQHTVFGVSGRLTTSTNVSIDHFFEEDGAKATINTGIDGSVVKTYGVDDDVSWATHPYAERSWGGADMDATELRRVMVFDKMSGISYFDYRPIFTISGDENEFHLLGYYIDDSTSERKIGNDLFIEK